jgi:hypothetical protein
MLVKATLTRPALGVASSIVDNPRWPPSAPDLSVEHFTDLPSERVRRKGFVQECDPGIEHAMLDNRVLRVPRHVDHFEFWPLLNQLPGQLRAAAPGITTSVSRTSIDGFSPKSRTASSASAAISTV